MWASLVFLSFVNMLGLIYEVGEKSGQEAGAIAVYEGKIMCKKVFDEWVCKDNEDSEQLGLEVVQLLNKGAGNE